MCLMNNLQANTLSCSCMTSFCIPLNGSYPLDFTFVCPTEILEFSDRIKEFEELNTVVIGASVDSKYAHQAFIDAPRKKGGLGGSLAYPLLEDSTHEISKRYGVYVEEYGHTVRGTIIIDGKGIVRHYSLNDPPVSRSVDEVLRLVRGYQYNDKHGEMCPAGWKKAGDATIETKNKLKFF